MRQCDTAERQASFDDWARLIRSEYDEMPDLNLTPAQMQRFWGIDSDMCRAVVERLVAQQALRLTLAGGYARLRAWN